MVGPLTDLEGSSVSNGILWGRKSIGAEIRGISSVGGKCTVMKGHRARGNVYRAASAGYLTSLSQFFAMPGGRNAAYVPSHSIFLGIFLERFDREGRLILGDIGL